MRRVKPGSDPAATAGPRSGVSDAPSRTHRRRRSAVDRSAAISGGFRVRPVSVGLGGLHAGAGPTPSFRRPAAKKGRRPVWPGTMPRPAAAVRRLAACWSRRATAGPSSWKATRTTAVARRPVRGRARPRCWGCTTASGCANRSWTGNRPIGVEWTSAVRQQLAASKEAGRSVVLADRHGPQSDHAGGDPAVSDRSSGRPPRRRTIRCPLRRLPRPTNRRTVCASSRVTASIGPT